MQKYNRYILLGVLAVIVVGTAIAVTLNFRAVRTTVVPSLGSSTITGTVFTDSNFDGLHETTGEPGIPGVKVTAHIAGTTNTVEVMTSVDPAGSYTLNVPDGNVRIEFSNFPQGMEPAKASATLAGVNSSSTTVSFVNVRGTLANQDFGLTYPNSYCQDNPQLGMPCNVNGDPNTAAAGDTNASGNQPAFYIVPFNAKTDPPTETKTPVLAKDVGAIWGNAYQTSTGTYFVSSVVKRHAGFGPLGIGGIYTIKPSADGSTAVVNRFIDLKTLEINFGSVTRQVMASCDPTDPRVTENCISTGKQEPNFDADAYAKTGKQGIGGISLSDDEKELWFVNLANKTLYALNLATKSIVHTYPITDPGCSREAGNEHRPWAVKYQGGKVYVGITCSGDASGTPASLRSYIRSVDPATGNQSDVLTVPLNYKRGYVAKKANGTGIPVDWKAWEDDPTQLPNYTAWAPTNILSFPQPILANIEFTGNGKGIVMGFIDRFGNQSGYANYSPIFSDVDQNNKPKWTNKSSRSSGDILGACMDASGAFVLENNAKCGANNTTKGAGNQQGPGGGEYFFTDWGFGYNNTAGVPFDHDEAALGSFVINPMTRETVAAVFDLLDPTRPEANGTPRTYSTGLDWISNLTGEDGSDPGATDSTRTHEYELYSSKVDHQGTFGKSNGIGQIQIACQNAPIEIGNRVWNDKNGNGEQDPDEPGIAGVTVKLFEGATEVATTPTNAKGEYFFGDLKPRTAYEIHIDSGNFNPGQPLAGFLLSPKDASGVADTIDSDAVGPSAGERDTIIAITTGGPGQNNHTYDFGFVDKASIGDFVWYDVNHDGIQQRGTNAEKGIDGVTVELFQEVSGSFRRVAGPITTTNNGQYLFDNLYPATYQVTFTTPGSYAVTTSNVGSDDQLDSDAVSVTGNGTKYSTEPFGLAAGTDDRSRDAGYYRPGEIGDFVWDDTDGDGLQSTGERGVAGVKVTLFQSTTQVSDPNITNPVTTDANGKYSFKNIPFSTTPYTVIFDKTTIPAGYDFTTKGPDNGSDPDDSDASTTSPFAAGPILIDGTRDYISDLTWDAGIHKQVVGTKTYNIGDFIWEDTTRNNMNDVPDEKGVAGVKVELLKAGGGVVVGFPSQTTGADGKYLFQKVPQGDYVVKFTPPSGYSFVTKDVDGNRSDAVDSDAYETTGQTDTIHLVADNLTVDAGLYKPDTIPQTYSLGDFVWNDTGKNPGNGIQEAGEQGIDGVKVTIDYCVQPNNPLPGQIPATTTTSGGGLYRFSGLQSAQYKVTFDLPDGYVFSEKDASPVVGDGVQNDKIDSDADQKTGVTNCIAVDRDIDTVDAGMHQPVVSTNTAALGDRIWDDSASAANGNQQNHVQDQNNAGVFLEPGINGVTVNLYSCVDVNGVKTPKKDVVLATDVTKNDGRDDGIYKFSNLAPGSYAIGVPRFPAGYDLVRPFVGRETKLDSNLYPATKFSSCVDLTNAYDDTIDVGLFKQSVVPPQLGSIGNFVWKDANKDGTQDKNETGVENVRVTLLRDGREADEPAVTGIDGAYVFKNLVLDVPYVIKFDLPGGFTFTTQEAGVDRAVDSDPDVATGMTAEIVLTAQNPNNDTIDAGLVESPTVPNKGSLGDRVWLDGDKNGLQDVGEVGLKDVVVILYDAKHNAILKEQTDDNGNYLFGNLDAGEYQLGFIAPDGYAFSPKDVPSRNRLSDEVDSDADVTTGETDLITLAQGQNDMSWDAGLHLAPAALGDFVWEDANGNGVQDQGELGVDGVKVTLYDAVTRAEVATTTTAVGPTGRGISSHQGFYEFTNLNPGTYYLVFDPSAVPGYAFTSANQDKDDAKDSDADVATGATGIITLTPNQYDATWDAGLVKPATLGDFVWDDANQNGIQDSGEKGIAGLAVKLYNSAGLQLGTPATTDASGKYSFTNLKPGAYQVEFTTAAGYTFSKANQGTDDQKDSDVELSSGLTAKIALASGQTDLSWDAGMFKPTITEQPASIGDFVWNDANQNGIQDAGETGLAGVTVKLTQCGGSVVASTVTDAAGAYKFINLAAGSYQLEFTPLTGYTFSAPDQGSDDTKDSDADKTTFKTICTTLSAGENDLTWDAGLVKTPVITQEQPASIGDYVWNDANNDGIQNANEHGISGVTVELHQCGGPAIAITKSGANGLYAFDNITPGSYQIKFVLPNGYQFAPMNKGGDFARDSDADQKTGYAVCTTLDAGEHDTRWDAGMRQIPDVKGPTIKPQPAPTPTATPVLPVTGGSIGWLIASLVLFIGGIVLVGMGIETKRSGRGRSGDEVDDFDDGMTSGVSGSDTAAGTMTNGPNAGGAGSSSSTL